MDSIKIAQEAELLPVHEVASRIGLGEDEVTSWGDFKGKVRLEAVHRRSGRPRGRLVLVTTINPTKWGEGKTTVTIGLSQAMWKIGHSSVLGVREPSLGPTMGIKGGAAGGGYSQVLPMEDINLHFTGDLYAVSSAHNLLAALLNNHMYHGNRKNIDSKSILWHRVMDMADRALRRIVVGLGGLEGIQGGVTHEDKFDITAASEVMAVLCLSRSIPELKEKLSRILVARDFDGNPVWASDIGGVGAMALLLKDALRPNIVQTTENTPAFVHGGPFANIAHGTSSILSTLLGLSTAEYFITEAGFGSDLGAEKFFNIVCRAFGIHPSATVLVVTVRSVKRHGRGSLKDGFENVRKHIENLQGFNVPVVVAVNRFMDDPEEDVRALAEMCQNMVRTVVVDPYMKGGEGTIPLAEAVVDAAEDRTPRYTYPLDAGLREKIELVAGRIYGADKVVYSVRAEKQIEYLEGIGLGNLPICMAKTQYSLSEDPKLLGRPEGFKLHIREVAASSGAGFIVPFTGTITTMPGLPRTPSAMGMDIDEHGRISGLF